MMRWFWKKQDLEVHLEVPSVPQAKKPLANPLSGDMAARLSPDLFRPDAQALLLKISSQLRGGETAPNEVDSFTEEMMKLISELRQKIFRRRNKKSDASIDTQTLLETLQRKLNDVSKNNILPRADLPNITEDYRQHDIVIDDEDSPPPQASTAKDEQDSPESLANPFSKVNINRRSEAALPGTAGANKTVSDSNPRKEVRQTEQTERATVSYKKKLMQTRFSRRRFLRDYNGSTILSLIAMFILLIGATVGTFLTNVTILIPKTRVNQDAGQQAETFRSEITFNEPKLAKLLQRRQNIDLKLEKALNTFVDTNQIRNDFSDFIATLEDDPRIEVSGQQIEAIESELENIESIIVSFNVKTSFLLWLKYRNKMIREINEINVMEERIKAPPGESTIDIFIKMSRPGRNKINNGT
jgi:flagellar biosynthesis chaperone FliJ